MLLKILSMFSRIFFFFFFFFFFFLWGSVCLSNPTSPPWSSIGLVPCLVQCVSAYTLSSPALKGVTRGMDFIVPGQSINLICCCCENIYIYLTSRVQLVKWQWFIVSLWTLSLRSHCAWFSLSRGLRCSSKSWLVNFKIIFQSAK